jgi:hypothetical protein
MRCWRRSRFRSQRPERPASQRHDKEEIVKHRTLRTWRSAFFTILASWLAGCAHQDVGEVRGSSVETFIPANAESYAMSENQGFVIGEPLAPLQLPNYPATADAPRGEVVVCLEVSIDRDGLVYASAPLTGLPGCPARIGDVAAELMRSARQATSSWRFARSRRCTYPQGYDAAQAPGCDGPVIKVEFVPIRLAFRFRFTRKAGSTGNVTMDRLHG